MIEDDSRFISTSLDQTVPVYLGTFHALRIKGTMRIQRLIGQSSSRRKKKNNKKDTNKETKSHLRRYSFKLNLENYRLDRKCYRDSE